MSAVSLLLLIAVHLHDESLHPLYCTHDEPARSRSQPCCVHNDWLVPAVHRAVTADCKPLWQEQFERVEPGIFISSLLFAALLLYGCFQPLGCMVSRQA